MRLLSELLGDPEMEALFSDDAQLRGLLDFESALAQAEAESGVIPIAAANVIARVCAELTFDDETRRSLAAGAARAGNVAIPLVEALTQAVAAVDPEAARWVHWGATSQDAIDTGLVLQLGPVTARLDQQLRTLERELATLMEAHRHTILAGRSWLQQALPTSFGLKVAVWLEPSRAVAGVTRARRTRRASCSSEAQWARSPRWASTPARSRRRWPLGSSCRRQRPRGTHHATVWWTSVVPRESSPGPWERSPVT